MSNSLNEEKLLKIIESDKNYEWLLEGQEINENEILFISDIEKFSEDIKKYLLNQIENKKFKVVVFVGDILSGLSTKHPAYIIFQNSYIAFEMFYDYKKIIKEHKKIDESEIARCYIGEHCSEYLLKEFKEQIKYFELFIKECYENKIPVVLFSGNHDSLLSSQNLSDDRFIPILKKINSLKGLKILPDLK